jgi:hypothetical protein
MKIHIIGVATTFMKGLAILARQAGHQVSGSDSCFDLPTRKQLTEAGVTLKEGFSATNIDDSPELVIIGNELEITNEELVAARRRAIPYISGVLWLEEFILNDRWAKTVPSHYDVNLPKPNNDKPVEHAPRPSDKPTLKHAPKPPPDSHSKLKPRVN